MTVACVPCYDVILLHCPTQTPVLHSGSRLDRQWYSLRGYRPFTPPPLPYEITCIYNTILNLFGCCFALHRLLLLLGLGLGLGLGSVLGLGLRLRLGFSVRNRYKT